MHDEETMKKYGGKRWFYALGCRDADLLRKPTGAMSWPIWAYEAYFAGYYGWAL
jgi:hypothetical protein